MENFNAAIQWVADLEYWAWWTFAIFLVIIEIFAPSFVFLWLGLSAAVVGLLVLLLPSLSWEYQWAAFAVFSVISIVVTRLFLSKNPGVEDNLKLNQRGAQYVGRSFTLSEAIVNGRGKIHVDDSQWAISGPDMSEGSTVTVTGTDGTLLIVEAKE
ncbi:NfeD family protein [Sneathiella aquimaris]|uniref:NfeD family protein n=1 Tax=Sneathiella aquimaris TaxID=2599305 RepID=UPI00146E630A|nr:NfeD family protein [Sneathiella aquimaris]